VIAAAGRCSGQRGKPCRSSGCAQKPARTPAPHPGPRRAGPRSRLAAVPAASACAGARGCHSQAKSAGRRGGDPCVSCRARVVKVTFNRGGSPTSCGGPGFLTFGGKGRAFPAPDSKCCSAVSGPGNRQRSPLSGKCACGQARSQRTERRRCCEAQVTPSKKKDQPPTGVVHSRHAVVHELRISRAPGGQGGHQAAGAQVCTDRVRAGSASPWAPDVASLMGTTKPKSLVSHDPVHASLVQT